MAIPYTTPPQWLPPVAGSGTVARVKTPHRSGDQPPKARLIPTREPKKMVYFDGYPFVALPMIIVRPHYGAVAQA